MTNEELRESLLAAPKNGYANLTPAQREEMNAYCKDYAAFMDACKTEREATAWTVREAEKRGFQPLVPGMDVKPGDKISLTNRGKTLLLRVLGPAPLPTGPNTSAPHVAPPRLALTPNPLFLAAHLPSL